MGKGRGKTAPEAEEPAAEATGHDAPAEPTVEASAPPPPAPKCVVLCRVQYGVPDERGGAVVFHMEPGDDVPEEFLPGLLEGVHYERR